MPPELPFKARRRLENTKYGPGEASVALGATEHDVTIPDIDTSILVDCVPEVMLNWLTSYGVDFLPGKSNFKEGFRVTFGAPAPAGAKIHYSMRVLA